MNRIVLLFLSFCLISCGNKRIELISERSGLELPRDYIVLENKTESSGIQDYEINVALKFDTKSLAEIMAKVDSLVLINKKWRRNNQEVIYYNRDNSQDFESITIDLDTGILKFNQVHI